MIKNITSNWTVFRAFRLAVGLFIMFEALRTANWFMVALAAAFIMMPVLNIGCCAAGNCGVSTKKETGNAENVEYEEVK